MRVLLTIAIMLSLPFLANAGLKEDRNNYDNWIKTYKTKSQDEQKKSLQKLTSYVLYPYAQYDYLTHNLSSISLKEMSDFTSKNKNFPYKNRLLTNYITQLTKQKKWNEIINLNAQETTALKCQYLYAQYQTGQKSQALAQVKSIWLSGRDLPSACDPLFAIWSNTKEKNTAIIQQRIELVLSNNNIRVAKYLTNQLPEKEKAQKTRLLKLFDQPNSLPEYVKNTALTPFSKQVALLSFKRFVNSDPTAARKFIPELDKKYKLTNAEKTKLYDLIAFNYFKSNATKEESQWLEKYLNTTNNPELIERSIRAALKTGNKNDLKKWINRLPKETLAKDEWQYWQAQVLLNEGKKNEANAQLKKLSLGRGFYPMVSAQQLGIPYKIDLDYSVLKKGSKISSQENKMLSDRYDNHQTIKTINELKYFAQYPEAKNEWLGFINREAEPQELAKLARYALNKGWGEYAIQATITGKLWDNWKERLPVVFETEYKSALKGKSISLTYSLAIARQESALAPSVQSPAGARGIMQLMPATAKETAKKIKNINYTSPQQLYDPKTNILLGTEFLNQVYNRFGKNRILASAAYNAGPTRVNRWLAESNNQIDAIAFIESIPFNETRNYVKSVLTYDYIYQLILNKKASGILTKSELTRKY